MRWKPRAAVLACAIFAGYLAWHWSIQAQGPAQPGANPGKFEFLVVESFDARYLGDSPGHMGRASLGKNSPRMALKDAVYRGTTRIGTVTHLNWNEANESLEIEFDPEAKERIAIGDPVWVSLGTTP